MEDNKRDSSPSVSNVDDTDKKMSLLLDSTLASSLSLSLLLMDTTVVAVVAARDTGCIRLLWTLLLPPSLDEDADDTLYDNEDGNARWDVNVVVVVGVNASIVVIDDTCSSSVIS